MENVLKSVFHAWFFFLFLFLKLFTQTHIVKIHFTDIILILFLIANFKDALLVEHKADKVWDPLIMDSTSEEEGNF